MVVNVNVAIPEETHELLKKLKVKHDFKNNAEVIDFCIKRAAKEDP